MALYSGGFGTGFLQGMNASMSLAKQYQEAQQLRARQDLAKQMADYMKGQDASASTPQPAQVGKVDMSSPQGAQIDAPAAPALTADSSSAPAVTEAPSASLSDTGFGNGFQYLNGA